MKKYRSVLNAVVFIIIIFLFGFCDKSDSAPDSNDPSNLSITIISIDDETGQVLIQCSALNAVEFQLYIGNATDPASINQNGFFEYTFDGPGDYIITVRAYGLSGRYIRKSLTISISPAVIPEVPLDKGYFSPETYEGYTLIWQDEFNGTGIDPSYWNFDIGDGCPNLCGWGNNELQYYLAENAWVANQYLTIEAREQQYAIRNYTSAKLTTKGRFSFRYGRVDIRALLPYGQGLWPALWMLGNDIDQVGWPRCGEIDIMEMIGGSNRENTCYGTIHWHDGNGHASYGGSRTQSSESFAEAYHVFSIIWDENKIRWFVDNEFYHEVTITDSQQTEFHQEFWLILNVAVGGNWPGNPDATTTFPQQMRVDYVRVFREE
jgi:beta-glucanase (GH16 family)